MMDADFARRTAELSSQLVSGLDMSTTMAGMDYNQTILPQPDGAWLCYMPQRQA